MKIAEFVRLWNEKAFPLENWTEHRETMKTFQTNLCEAYKSTYGKYEPRGYVGASHIGQPVILTALTKVGYKNINHFQSLGSKYYIYTGHIWEATLYTLMQMYGVPIHSSQKEINYHGVVGHIDGMIGDSCVIDIKVSNNRFITEFSGFIRGTQGYEDTRGYVTQLAIYRRALKCKDAGWLMLDRFDGTLHYIPLRNKPLEKDHLVNAHRKIKILQRVKTLKDLVNYCPVPPPNGTAIPNSMKYCSLNDCFYSKRPTEVLPKKIIYQRLKRLLSQQTHQ